MDPQVISFRCKVMDPLGRVLSLSFNEGVINQLGDGDPRLSDLIQGLQSVRAGEKRRIFVPASRAYGSYDPRLSIKVDLKSLPTRERIHLGSQVIYPHSNSNDARIYRVVEMTAGYVILEGNHPFAGMDLVFEVDIISARRARRLDLSQPGQKWFSEPVH